MTQRSRALFRTALVVALLGASLTACAVDPEDDLTSALEDSVAAQAPSEQAAAADVVTPFYEELIIWRCSTTGGWYGQESHCTASCGGRCDPMLVCMEGFWQVPCN